MAQDLFNECSFSKQSFVASLPHDVREFTGQFMVLSVDFRGCVHV